jgi:hypothetical protein
MKQLPKYYAIRRDEKDPLWGVFEQWMAVQKGSPFIAEWEYLGMFGADLKPTPNGSDELYYEVNPKIISLNDWAEATGNLPKSPTHCKQPESCGKSLSGKCVCPKPQEMKMEDALIGAANAGVFGGKPTTPETVQFDPSKNHRVSFDTGRTWNSTEWHFVGFDLFGDKVVQHIEARNFQIATNVEELPEFTADMLEAGEYMVVESNGFK